MSRLVTSVYLLPVRNWKSLLIVVGLAQAKAVCSIWFDCWTEKSQLPMFCSTSIPEIPREEAFTANKMKGRTSFITNSKGTCMWPGSARKALGDEAFRHEIDDANEWSHAVVSKAYIVRIQCRFGGKKPSKCSNMLWRRLRWYACGISRCCHVVKYCSFLVVHRCKSLNQLVRSRSAHASGVLHSYDERL